MSLSRPYSSTISSLTFFLPIVCILLYPTDEYAALPGKVAIIVCASFMGGALQKNLHFFLVTLFVVCLCYLSTVWSVTPAHSFYGASQVTYYALVFVIFYSVKFCHRSLIWGTRLLVGISISLVIDGFRQLFFGYAISSALDPVTQNWIAALSGRVFSKFALPSQLAGYLLMILPLNMLLIFREKLMVLRIGWGVVLVLNGVIFFYAKSYGASLSLLCMLMAGLSIWFLQTRRFSWLLLLKGMIGFLMTGGFVFYLTGLVRGQYLWNFQGNNPLWYRFLNWKTAWQILMTHPFLGTGFSTFGKMYPQYMQPGANESQYVHNTYLQFGVELGLIGVLFTISLALLWIVRGFRSLCFSQKKREAFFQENRVNMQTGLAYFMGGLGFLLHNGIDFDFYVFPLGLLGMVMLALTCNIFRTALDENTVEIRLNTKKRVLSAVVLCCVLAPMFFKDWRYVSAKQQKAHAVSSLPKKHYQEALSHIRRALQAAPDVGEYKALEGSIFLYLQHVAPALERFQEAIQAEPETPWFHAALAEAYLNQQNVSMAYLESRRAAELFPQKPQYQKRFQEIQRLIALAR